jgi:hypothetical protein
VELKRSFLDETSRNNRTVGGEPAHTGERWCVNVFEQPRPRLSPPELVARSRCRCRRRYTQSAIRAVNQALGRVIRHRNDFGAVLLADERFAYTGVQSQLSVWIRPHVQRHESFGKGLARWARRIVAFLYRCRIATR